MKRGKKGKSKRPLTGDCRNELELHTEDRHAAATACSHREAQGPASAGDSEGGIWDVP